MSSFCVVSTNRQGTFLPYNEVMKIFTKIILITLVSALVLFLALRIYDNQGASVENIPESDTSLVNFINQSVGEMTGRETSEEKSKTSTSDFPICEGAESASFKCYEKHYTDLVLEQGIPEAFADIRVRENENSYIKSQCHPLAHVIGRAAAKVFPDILDAYSKGDSYCWSGYYHGLLEEIIDKKGKDKTLEELNTICSRVPGKDVFSFDYYNCVHGLGHGLMGAAGQNLFDALSMCDKLEGSWERSSCYSGVFMENVIIESKGGTTEYLRPSEPVYPCNAVGADYKPVCYLMQTSYMLKVSNNNFATVFDLCSKVESPYPETCYQSLGRDASGQSSSDVEKTKNTCYLGKDFDQKSNCIIGAVKDFISYYHSDTEAKKLCGALTADLQTICSETAESYYQSL